jgi:hypothetical protein
MKTNGLNVFVKLTDSNSSTLLWDINQQEKEGLGAIKGTSGLVYWLWKGLQEINPWKCDDDDDDDDDDNDDDDDEFR